MSWEISIEQGDDRSAYDRLENDALHQWRVFVVTRGMGAKVRFLYPEIVPADSYFEHDVINVVGAWPEQTGGVGWLSAKASFADSADPVRLEVGRTIDACLRSTFEKLRGRSSE